MIRISQPKLDNDDIERVVEVLKSGNLARGKVVVELEDYICKTYGIKYALAVTNGTVALEVAIKALGIKPGDEVIVTPFSFVATVNAILLNGGIPVFVDIKETDFNMDTDQVEAAITSKTKAIVAVDLYGQNADWKKLRNLAGKYNLKLIEDAAQAIGAAINGKFAGSFGDVGCFSFYATKNIFCGEGGMITTNNRSLYKQMTEYTNQGQRLGGARYDYARVGTNARFNEIMASIVLSKLKKYKLSLAIRSRNADQYLEGLKEVVGIRLPMAKPGFTHVWHQFTILVDKKSFGMDREELKAKLFESGIETGIYYPKPLYRVKHLIKTNKIKLPICEKVCKSVLSLPVHEGLTEAEVKKVIKQIQVFGRA